MNEAEKNCPPQFSHAAMPYLSSMLFRHFLPFLSWEDEYKLINGMRYFVSSLFASNTIRIGADINSDANETIEILKHILEHFRGVEAIKVLSEQSTSATDKRSCVGITLRQTSNLWVSEPKTRHNSVRLALGNVSAYSRLIDTTVTWPNAKGGLPDG